MNGSTGVLLGGVAGILLFCKWRKKSFLRVADEVVIPAALLLALGRIGNFINGQIYGPVTDVWWAVKFPDAEGLRHPVTLYESVKNLAIIPILLAARNKCPYGAGRLLAQFIYWYGSLRIFADCFREYGTEFLGIGTGQYFNFFMALAGIGLYIWCQRVNHVSNIGPIKIRKIDHIKMKNFKCANPRLGQSSLLIKRAVFAVILIFSATIPSSWTQGVLKQYRNGQIKNRPGKVNNHLQKFKSIFVVTLFLVSVFILAGPLGPETAYAQIDARQKVIEFMRSAEMGDKLDEPVRISGTDSGIIRITDEGHFITQHVVMQPELGADVEVIKEPDFKIPATCTKAVIVTHGWLDKGAGSWPADMANAISQRVDPNEWVCIFFDWANGASVVSPVECAKYARDVAGVRLGRAILELGTEFKHVHLIAHSAGCWAINDAARRIASRTGSMIHLTFLDAYVPPFWKEKDLGRIETTGWAEHYYTKDLTLASTHIDLSGAYNVDITGIDRLAGDHKFPYRWYYATIAGRYRQKDRERGEEVITGIGGIDYGFDRSLEAGRRNWQKSLTLNRGRNAVLLRKSGNM